MDKEKSVDLDKIIKDNRSEVKKEFKKFCSDLNKLTKKKYASDLDVMVFLINKFMGIVNEISCKSNLSCDDAQEIFKLYAREIPEWIKEYEISGAVCQEFEDACLNKLKDGAKFFIVSFETKQAELHLYSLQEKINSNCCF